MLAQSYAALTVAFDKASFVPYVPITLVKNGKTVSIPRMMVDTGASATFVNASYAKTLGIDLKKGIAGQVVAISERCPSYTHIVDLRVGNLSLLRNVQVTFVEKPCDKALLGWQGILQKAKLEVYGGMNTPKLTYSELAVAAMANSSAYFRSRI